MGQVRHRYFRRVFSRFDTYARRSLAFVHFASTVIWLKYTRQRNLVGELEAIASRARSRRLCPPPAPNSTNVAGRASRGSGRGRIRIARQDLQFGGCPA